MIAPTVSPARHGNGLPGQGLIDLAAIMSAHTQKEPGEGKRAMLRLGHGASKPRPKTPPASEPPTAAAARAARQGLPLAPDRLAAPFCLVHGPLDRPFRRRFSAPGRVHPRRALAGTGLLGGLRRRLLRRFVGRFVLGRRVLRPGSVHSLGLFAIGLFALAILARRILSAVFDGLFGPI